MGLKNEKGADGRRRRGLSQGEEEDGMTMLGMDLGQGLVGGLGDPQKASAKAT